MKTVIAFLIGAVVGVGTVAAVQPPPTRPTDCGCKDCEKEKKCQPRCFCAQPLQ